MDEIDQANDTADKHLQAALESHWLFRPRPTGESLTHCEECDEPIPQKRRELVPGCRLCVECQREREK